MLISEPFTYEYFKDVFLNQYVRILCHFLKRVVTDMWQKNILDVEVIKSGETGKSLDDSKPYKVLLVPYLHSRNYNEIIEFRQRLPPQQYLIVLNMFCYHTTLKKLADLDRCTIVNLYCIASESRFADILHSNLLTEEAPTTDLFVDRQLVHRAEQSIEHHLRPL